MILVLPSNSAASQYGMTFIATFSTKVTLECLRLFCFGQKKHQVAHKKHFNQLTKEKICSHLMITALGNNEF